MEYVGKDRYGRYVFVNSEGDYAGFDRRQPEFDEHQMTAWYHPVGYVGHYGPIEA